MGRKNIKRNKKGKQYTMYQVMPSTYSNTESQYNPNSYYAGDPLGGQNLQKKLENEQAIQDQETLVQDATFKAEEKTVNSVTMPGMLARSGKALKTFNTARAGFNAAKVLKSTEMGAAVVNPLIGAKGAELGLKGGLNGAKGGSALGAGWKALGHAGKANLIGTAASFVGMGLKKTKFGNDKDDTTYKFGEGMADVLQYGGQGAAWGSFLGPIGTGVGAVLGSAYGLWKGFRNRRKARNLKGNQDTRMKKIRSRIMNANDNKFLVSRGNDTGRPVMQAQ
tara:strand:- start:289 stop:1125 length:837 start_codon:yes stop_codon:yes gene_type:complete